MGTSENWFRIQILSFWLFYCPSHVLQRLQRFNLQLSLHNHVALSSSSANLRVSSESLIDENSLNRDSTAKYKVWIGCCHRRSNCNFKVTSWISHQLWPGKYRQLFLIEEVKIFSLIPRLPTNRERLIVFSCMILTNIYCSHCILNFFCFKCVFATSSIIHYKCITFFLSHRHFLKAG